uniref:Putative secreted peptide n=1 Tax=Anopheles braziliensis TaxID=58242 RepID=A0A2M3ZQR1_9DIPT
MVIKLVLVYLSFATSVAIYRRLLHELLATLITCFLSSTDLPINAALLLLLQLPTYIFKLFINVFCSR